MHQINQQMKLKSDFPFRVKQFPFFYGWIIMVAGTIGVLFSIPGQTMGAGAFTNHLLDALELKRDTLTIAYMIGTAASAFLLPKSGRLWDQHGARIVLSIAALTLAFFLFVGSKSPELSHVLENLLHITYSQASFVVILVVFFSIRFSGQGVLTLVSRNVTMKWFDQNRGLANGISSTFVSLGFSVAPLLLMLLIQNYSWEGAWQIIAIGLLIFVVFVIIIIRDNPEDCGLIPDGKILPPKRKKSTNFVTRKQYSLKEARSTYTFWIYTLTLAFYSMYLTGITFHIESIFESYGYLGKDGFAIFLPTAIIAVSISLVGNVISDYVKLQYLLFIMVLGALLSIFALINLDAVYGVTLLIAGNGIMGGIFVILTAVAWPRFFGRKNLGAISGLSGAVMQFTSAFGPILFSRVFTVTGSYSWAGKFSLIYVLIIAIGAIKAINPQKIQA